MRTVALEEAPTSKVLTPLRALIVGYSDTDLDLILFQLKESGFDVDHPAVESREDFRSAVAENSFDVALADYRLPSWSGLDALVELRGAGKDIPFLLVAGTLGEEVAVECIKQGANDYILKDHLSRLPIALTRAMTEKGLRDENARAHEALRMSEARNRDLAEHAVYGISRVSSHGNFIDGNPALLRILGCSNSEPLKRLNFGRDLFRFPEQHAQLMRRCRELGQIHGSEVEWRRSDGGIVAVRLDVRRATACDETETFEIIAEDVTELRGMERQLRQAQKFEAIGQLAGGVAHDSNNLLGAILGWAEIGSEQSRDQPKVAERFEHIREQAERAAALTRELLTFARHQALQPRAVDLNAVASGLFSLLDKVIGEHIEVKYLTSRLDPVKGDPIPDRTGADELVHQCARCDAGRRPVGDRNGDGLDEPCCRFYPYVSAGRYAVLSVADTGVGMDVDSRRCMAS